MDDKFNKKIAGDNKNTDSIQYLISKRGRSNKRDRGIDIH